ncbi:MAG: oxidoreductase [Candidatus Pelagibacter sp.]|nr:oxidoreductase [Candidatus Pelagibacter sp.]OUT96064.1 MAG: oxidoreductase [Gammaproteobacteria bacterium TMED36]
MTNLFDLTGKTALITGGGGLLGPKHAEAIVEYGGKVILADWHEDRAKKKAELIGENASYEYIDVTDKESIQSVVDKYDKIDILINNAAKDPKVKKGGGLTPDSRFETMTEEYWKEGIDACVNGTFLCSQIVSNKMLENGGGVILNISSDLGVISPDQRIYRQDGVDENRQNVKPITYSAAKWAVVGMTKYLSVYFAQRGIRVNCLSPTGVYNNHPEDFVKKLSNIIPMGRMADIDEYKGAIVFLCSDASSYMTGENLIIDGGKTVW